MVLAVLLTLLTVNAYVLAVGATEEPPCLIAASVICNVSTVFSTRPLVNVRVTADTREPLATFVMPLPATLFAKLPLQLNAVNVTARVLTKVLVVSHVLKTRFAMVTVPLLILIMVATLVLVPQILSIRLRRNVRLVMLVASMVQQTATALVAYVIRLMELNGLEPNVTSVLFPVTPTTLLVPTLTATVAIV